MLKYGFRVLLQPPWGHSGVDGEVRLQDIGWGSHSLFGLLSTNREPHLSIELSPALCPHCHLIWDDGEHHLTRYGRVWSQKGTPSLQINLTCTDCNGVSSSYVGPIHPNQLPDRCRDTGIKPVQV